MSTDPFKKRDPFAKPKDPFAKTKQEGVGFGQNLYRTLGGAARDVGVATAELLLPKDRFGPLNVAKGIREGKTLEEMATDPSVLEQAIKSVPVNSSHGYISYAVFCLKKKNNLVGKRRNPSADRTD